MESARNVEAKTACRRFIFRVPRCVPTPSKSINTRFSINRDEGSRKACVLLCSPPLLFRKKGQGEFGEGKKEKKEERKKCLGEMNHQNQRECEGSKKGAAVIEKKERIENKWRKSARSVVDLLHRSAQKRVRSFIGSQDLVFITLG